MKKTKLLISSPQLLNSHSSLIQVIPGVYGKVICPLFVAIRMKNSTVPYSTNGNLLKLTYHNHLLLTIGDILSLDLESIDSHIKFQASDYSDIYANIVGMPLVLKSDNQNPTLGDGDLKIKIFYTLF